MKTLAVIKTKYASIEKLCPSKVEAFMYIKELMKQYEVISYEIKEM